MKVKIKRLKSVTNQILKKYGYSKKEIKVISEILLFAQLRGNNQGIVKLAGTGIPRIEDDGPITIEKETKVSALVNGRKNHAMVVFDYATELAISKAKEIGVGIVGKYNSGESTGALGYYVEKVTKEKLIGIAYASAPFQTTAPFGSSEALLCTNPIGYGIPTSSDPILLDFATSEMAYFGLVEAKIAGRKVSINTGFDSDGYETTNPEKIMNGAIKAFAGHKGSGLALIVQIFAGPLVKAGYIGKEVGNAGNLIMAIDPEILTDTETLAEKTDDILNIIKNSRKTPETSEIFIPGERGYKKYHESIKSGEVEIDNNLWEELLKVIKK